MRDRPSVSPCRQTASENDRRGFPISQNRTSKVSEYQELLEQYRAPAQALLNHYEHLMVPLGKGELKDQSERRSEQVGRWGFA